MTAQTGEDKQIALLGSILFIYRFIMLSVGFIEFSLIFINVSMVSFHVVHRFNFLMDFADSSMAFTDVSIVSHGIRQPRG